MITIPEKLKEPVPFQKTPGVNEGYITYEAHLRAYAIYSAIYGNSQSAGRLAERGGFGASELDVYYSEWKNHIIDSEDDLKKIIMEPMRDVRKPRTFKPKYSKAEAIALIEELSKRKEPFFLLRARDKASVMTVKYYVELLKDLVKGDFDSSTYQHAVDTERFVTYMLEWQLSHTDELRNPD